jgi:hypothetical protein
MYVSELSCTSLHFLLDGEVIDYLGAASGVIFIFLDAVNFLQLTPMPFMQLLKYMHVYLSFGLQKTKSKKYLTLYVLFFLLF